MSAARVLCCEVAAKRVRQQEHDSTGDLLLGDPLTYIVQGFTKISHPLLESSSFFGARHCRQEPDSGVAGFFRLPYAVFRSFSIPYLEFCRRKTCERAAGFEGVFYFV